MSEAKNKNLSAAKKAKSDEFYTQWADIEKEINAYLDYNPDLFRGKTILLPCDDPEWSNFTKFFALHFTDYGIKKLISTSYAKDGGRGKKFVLEAKDVNGDEVINLDDLQWEHLEGDGDFRSDEVTALRDEADFIITNPPFSLFREFVAWLMAGNVKFAVIGNMNAITYKEVFPLIKDNKVWLGPTISSGDREFRVPNSYPLNAAGSRMGVAGEKYIRVKGVRWFTNIEHGRRHTPLVLMTETDNIKFGPKGVKGVGYQKYDNYDAIEVPKTIAVPSDFDGVMGVPISFLDKYCPEQFEILGSRRWAKSAILADLYCGDKTVNTDFKTLINGCETYDRIFIRRKDVSA